MSLLRRLFSAFLLCSCLTAQAQQAAAALPVQWTTVLPGDYTFATQWSYAGNVFRNPYGQLVCDGLCTERQLSLTDSTGRILPDSLHVYYQLLDTTHYYHTFSGTSSCSEFAGTHFLYAQKQPGGSVLCYTLADVATHCTLSFLLSGDSCTPAARLTSIIAGEDHSYVCTSGYIRIDPELWKKGVLKAVVHFEFTDADSPREERIVWEGITLCPINTGQ